MYKLNNVILHNAKILVFVNLYRKWYNGFNIEFEEVESALNSASDIQQLRGIGAKRAALYRKLGINTIGDLLYFYPRSYIDITDVKLAIVCPDDVPCCLKVHVASKQVPRRVRKGMTVYKIDTFDESSKIYLTLFNQSYAFEAINVGEEYLIFGKLRTSGRVREMISPLIIPYSSDIPMKAVYRLTSGLTSNAVSTNIREALKLVDNSVTDYLPAEIREKYGLSHISFALENIHFPKDPVSLDAARKRLCFEELFIVQLALTRLRTSNKRLTSHPIKKTDLGEFYAALPFEPTGAQKRAIDDCIADMQKTSPMNRLVQGDVGSGKTLVAAAAAFCCCKSGYQAAMMAPTEILAVQHSKTMEKLLSPFGIRVALLTGSMKASQKKAVLSGLESGDIDFIIGTHALITGKVKFKNPALVITDEQHRFGVGQRAVLSEKGCDPHTLVMSATPIPRTLSLIIYGDLELSVIDELPKGRTPIETFVIDPSKRGRAYNFVREHIKKGLQAYAVCPLIENEEGEPSELLAVTEYADALKKAFPEFRVGILHGKMKAAEKDAVMAEFRDKNIDILVCTTVVEVGVDVPNAVIMLIENAERFGLSQLHQLRGRVGRGTEKSYCILISDNLSGDSGERLMIMKNTTDGFKIAEEDLNLRGAGDLIGVRQHGLPSLRLEGMYTDKKLVLLAREASRDVLSSDPELKSPEMKYLRAKVNSMLENIINN